MPSEYGLPSRIVSETGTTFESEKIPRLLQVPCFVTNTDRYMALLQIRSTPLGPVCHIWQHSSTRPTRGLLLKLSRIPMVVNNDEDKHSAPVERQQQNNKI